MHDKCAAPEMNGPQDQIASAPVLAYTTAPANTQTIAPAPLPPLSHALLLQGMAGAFYAKKPANLQLGPTNMTSNLFQGSNADALSSAPQPQI